VAVAQRLLRDGKHNVSEIAKVLGVYRATIYRHLPVASNDLSDRVSGGTCEGDPRKIGTATLNELAVPTALTGRQWYPSTARNAALAYERDITHDTAKSL
jgi:hypothetical protein